MKQTNQSKKVKKNGLNVIIGAGGHAVSVIEILKTLKINIHSLLDLKINKNKKLDNIPIISNLNQIDVPKNYLFNLYLALGNNLIRKKNYLNFIKSDHNVIGAKSQYAYISKSSDINKSTFVGNQAYIGPKTIINENCIVNTKCIIEHETIIDSHTNICPGVNIGGRCKIGKNVFIGLGSNISDNITIEDNVTIGSGSVITKNIKKNIKVVGINRVIK